MSLWAMSVNSWTDEHSRCCGRRSLPNTSTAFSTMLFPRMPIISVLIKRANAGGNNQIKQIAVMTQEPWIRLVPLPPLLPPFSPVVAQPHSTACRELMSLLIRLFSPFLFPPPFSLCDGNGLVPLHFGSSSTGEGQESLSLKWVNRKLQELL